MPYINVKMSKKIGISEMNEIKAQLGKAIEIFPGKSESWLMCCVESDKNMWFQGDNSEDCVFVEVKLFGSVDKKASEKFTEEICEYFDSHFGIPTSRVYVRYSGGTDWGWNCNNF